MDSLSWRWFDCYDSDELVDVQAKLEKHAADAFARGDNDEGQEYYHLYCQSIVAQALRDVPFPDQGKSNK